MSKFISRCLSLHNFRARQDIKCKVQTHTQPHTHSTGRDACGAHKYDGHSKKNGGCISDREGGGKEEEEDGGGSGGQTLALRQH